MRVADLFVKCLENEGVQYVFGVPGEENEDLLFSLERSSITFVTTRHEQGAAFMADVWGRLTGKAGVCLSTLGPGATNLVTGVADAYLDKSPLVAITAQAGLSRIHKESHQYLDVVNMFRPITKWNVAVSTPDEVPEVVRKAFKIAESEKPGATHIELSEDLASLESDRQPIQPIRVRRPDPDAKAIAQAVALLKGARKPLIIAGNGAIRKQASGELRKFVGRYHIPVVNTFMGQGAISDDSPESLDTIGFGFRDLVMEAVDQTDLILTVGYDLAVETQLTKAKSTRSEAELERQRVANEILEATREVCKSIISDSKRSLEKARRAESEAENKLLESQHDRDQSQALKVEAEAFYENARQRAEELVNQSRAAAERESMEIKQQTTLEAQRMLAHVEAIRSAAKEELEAQRIYVETARLKLEARGILAQLQEELAGPQGTQGDGANGNAPGLETPEEWLGLGQAESVSNQEETYSEVETEIPDEEKKGSRRSASSG